MNKTIPVTSVTVVVPVFLKLPVPGIFKNVKSDLSLLCSGQASGRLCALHCPCRDVLPGETFSGAVPGPGGLQQETDRC